MSRADDMKPAADAFMREEIERRRVLAEVDALRNDEHFMNDLRERIAQDWPVLEGLRQYDEHDHRYPPNNGAGFPMNECMVCGAVDESLPAWPEVGGPLAEAIAERDRARAIAAALEAELAEARS
jgi:hypothetical protein